MNVTTTVTLAPALDAPSTTTTLDEDDMVQDVTAVPPTVVPLRQSPPCAMVIKLEPVTVMLLLT